MRIEWTVTLLSMRVILISVQGVLSSFLQLKAHVVFALPNPLLCIHCPQCVVTYLD